MNIKQNSIVSIVKAKDYNYTDVYKAIENGLKLIGGLEKIVKRSDNVFVKINHLPPPSPPERGIVTHPVFVKAVVDILKTTGANISVGDDIDTELAGQNDLEATDGFSISGIRQVCHESGVTLCNLRESGFVETACNGVMLDKVYVARTALEADVIVNLPKLKTHALAIYTGGIKNMFGAIPKGQRLRYHDKYRQIDDFNQVLIDVFSAMKPGLTIIDGIIAMEGMGPAAGGLKNLGIILASQDTVALDAVAMKITGLEPQSNLITNLADERGLGISNLENIDIVGESLSDVTVTDFKYPDTQQISRIFMRRAPKFLTTFLNNLSVVKPRVISKLCIGCLECKKTCPANAISIVHEKAFINHRVCIMCYCCHEACRSDAIIVKQVVYKRIIRYLVKTFASTAGRVIKKLLRKS
jgi:uncharacterized protein (DUF362 family)/NAD-dependent dihydropyrimidine dehydrogenase PreA subunit